MFNSKIDKIVTVNECDYRVRKFTAKESIVVMKTFAAKIIPMLTNLEDLFKSFEKEDILKQDVFAILKELNLDSMSKALDLLSEDDINMIMDMCMKKVFYRSFDKDEEFLSCVIDFKGNYTDEDIEYDTTLQFQLVVEVIKWGLAGFFQGNSLALLQSKKG